MTVLNPEEFVFETKRKQIRSAFFKLLPVQIFGVLIGAINHFIDSLIVGNFLDTETMAAVGFFAPLGTIIGLSHLIVVGVQILCGNYIGSGERKKLLSLFSSGVVFLGCAGLAFSTVCFFGRMQIAQFLGAEGNTAVLLADYISGYALGITGQILCGMMMCFLPFNNDIKLSYIAIAFTMFLNVSGDLFFVVVLEMGAFGLGSATALSYLLTTVLISRSYLNEDKAIHLQFKDFDFIKLISTARLGLPSLMFTLGITIKAYIMNIVLAENVGDAAVAVMNIQGDVCAILGAVPFGCAEAFVALGSIYYGEEDRFSFQTLVKTALMTCIILSGSSVLLLMFGSTIIPSMFFDPSEKAWEVASTMLLLFPSFLIFNGILNVLMKSYQVQGKISLVNALSFSENLIMACIAAVLTPMIGSNGVWLSFPLAELICIAILSISVFVRAGKITFDFADWLKLDADFGADTSNSMEFTVSSTEKDLNVTDKIIDVIEFCKERGVDERRSSLVGLCAEEMTNNTIIHGFKEGEEHTAVVRVTVKNELVLRIRDDCPEFSPKKRLEQFSVENFEKNVGIRLVSKLAKEMNYQNNAGINTIIIKI